MTISQIKQKQKQIILDEIELIKTTFKNRMAKLFKAHPAMSQIGRKELAEIIWNEDYEKTERELQIALIKFEKYEH